MLRHSEIPVIKILFVFLLALGCSLSGLKLNNLLLLSISYIAVVIFHFLKRTYGLPYSLVLFVALFFSFNAIVSSRVNYLESAPPQIKAPVLTIEKASGESTLFKKYYAQSTQDYNVLVYLKKELPSLNIGDTLYSFRTAEKTVGSGLPGKFNYKSYLLSKEITHQVFIYKEGQFKLKKGADNFASQIHHLRNHIIGNIERDFKEPFSRGLVTAILTGDKSNLKEEILKEFNSLGISHFLAVSGLHVGIIFLILKSLLRFDNKKRNAFKVLKTVVILAVLWFYAAITQFSPSVTRATFMFSLLLIGASLKRKSNPLNFWATACLCILLYSPYQILDLGFQLSFGAVASILIFFRPIQNWFLSPWAAINKAWDILVVSFTAQLGTFPIIMYHFGQFPIYFLVANLWLSFFTFILVGLCFIYLICSLSLPLASLLSELINITCSGLHFGIEGFTQLPHKLYHIDLSTTSFSLLLASMVLLFAFIVSRKKGALISSVLLAVGFFGYRIKELHFKPYWIAHKNKKTHKAVLVTPSHVYAFQSPFEENFQQSFEWQNFFALHQNKTLLIPQKELSQIKYCYRMDITLTNSKGTECNTYFFVQDSSIPTTSKE